MKLLTLIDKLISINEHHCLLFAALNLILFRYFKEHPEGQAHFKTLQGDPENLRKDPKMFAHASNVTYNISAMINNIEEPDVVLAILDRLGNSHNRRKVKANNIGVTTNLKYL